MDTQRSWGELRSAVHAGASVATLAGFVPMGEEALRYLMDHVGGSRALWLGIHEGSHVRLSWLIPHMIERENEALLRTLIEETVFVAEVEFGVNLLNLGVDAQWLLDWQVHTLREVATLVCEETSGVWGLMERLVSSLDSVLQLPEVPKHDDDWYEEPLPSLWGAASSQENFVRANLPEGQSFSPETWVLRAIQHIAFTDITCHEYNPHRATRRVGVSLGYALRQHMATGGHDDAQSVRLAEQAILKGGARFLLDRYAQTLWGEP